ncbi:MAG: hypothetical protein VX640_13140 [Pseudomonadota bacterium]|nr:hypothetical protein [Pseudomonadota bacterium]
MIGDRRIKIGARPKRKTPPSESAPGDAQQHPPAHGSHTEKRRREKDDGKFNYGGRDECPDPDVNPAPALSVDREADKAKKTASFDSPLPPRAFRLGDLFGEE